MHYYASQHWLPTTEQWGRAFDVLLHGGERMSCVRERVMWGDVAAWRPYRETVDRALPRVRVRAEMGGE